MDLTAIKDSRRRFALALLSNPLMDIKATHNGKHLCLLGKLRDGRYFAARFDGNAELDNPVKIEEADLTRVEVSYTETRSEAEWLDDYYYMKACAGMYDEE